MFTSTTKTNRLGIASVIAGGLLGVAITVGSVATGADDLWRKVGQVISPANASNRVEVGAFEQGLAPLATSTSGTTFGALSESQMLATSIITLTPNVSSATTTLMSTSTMTSLLSEAGRMREWLLINGTSTEGITVGIAAGTGINLTSGTLNNVQIPPDGAARVLCGRLASGGDVHCDVNINVEGD